MTLLSRWMVVCALVVLGGCSCSDGDDPTDGGTMDGAGGDDGAVDVDTGPVCVGRGGACTMATECCEGPCEGGTCTMGSCAATGVACSAGGDCCSGSCEGGTCAPGAGCNVLGAPCTVSGDCCSGACNDSGGAECMGGGDCVCGPSPLCTPREEACDDDSDCCNNLCDRPGGAASGSCAAPGACLTAGEPCGTEGLNGSCCSTVCLDTDGTGPRCQFLGGCRVQDELCTSDAQCCSGACRERGRTADDRPITRCANVDSCLPAGEVCGEGGASSNCCPNGGGDTGCEPTGTGFRRCFGGDGTCTLPGRTCTDTSECCVETFPAITCAPGRGGALVCCLADGEECAFGDVCCGGICAPDPTDGVLRCGTMCIPDGGACTSAADCCGCGCVPDGAGGQVCTNDPSQCAVCTGPQLGEVCDPMGEPCCNAPTVVCSGGIEFNTCILAP